MKISDWLTQATAALANSPTPRLDAEVILGNVLGKNRTELVIDTASITGPQLKKLGEHLKRRAQGEPVAYIVGHKEFMGLDILVGPAVLIPRPESESIVRAATELVVQNNIPLVHEVGTGSGALAIGLARLAPTVKIIASDISPDAIEVARRNVVAHGLSDRIQLLESDLADHVMSAELVVANLPYLPLGLEVSPELSHEPSVALWSGPDGLDHYRRLLTKSKAKYFVIEIGENQYGPLLAWIHNNLPNAKTSKIWGLDRCITGMVIQTKVVAN